MNERQKDLRSYYEKEARLRLRQPPHGRRATFRDDFVALLQRERRTSVLDFGAGPGEDGRAFVDGGFRFVGVDLAHGNCTLAADRSITVVQGSIDAPPFRPRSFDAGWSMSTLMHVPEDEVADTLEAMTAPLRPGAPLAVGLWGGKPRELIGESKIEGHRRMFSLRPFSRNRELLAACGRIEAASTWDLGPDDWEYHVLLIRIDGHLG